MTRLENILYTAVNDAAEAGKPCPTNAELGHLAGLTGSQASEMMRKLNRMGLLTSKGSGGRRTVTVVATGKATLWTRKNRQDIKRVDYENRAHDSEGVCRDMAKGCERLHQATLALYGRMANARGVGMQTAMWHAQHGRDVVEAISV